VGDTGPGVVQGKPEESELAKAIRHGPNGYQMSARQESSMPRFFNPISSFGETWKPQRFSSGGIVHELRFSTIDDHYCRVLCQELVERDTARKTTHK
jgi:hypothetical protein